MIRLRRGDEKGGDQMATRKLEKGKVKHKGITRKGDSLWLDFYYRGKRYREGLGPVSMTYAKERLILKKRDLIEGQNKPKIARVSFKQFKEEFLKWSKGNKKPKSSLRDECSLKHLQAFFNDKLLSEVSPFLVEKYKLLRKDEGAKPRTIAIELACLRHIFNLAMKWGKAASNPVQGVKFPKEPQAKDRILSEEEEPRLLEAVRTGHKAKHLEAIIVTALNTGMRKGEILNLKWENVDFKNRVITVEGTKTGEIRRIPMNNKLTEIFQSAKKESKGEFVFSENGNPYGDVKTGWWTALERAGIENFRFHDLRHTFGSRLGMSGVDVKAIADLMGHKTIQMTMRYSHPTPEYKRKAVELLDRTVTKTDTTEKLEEKRKVVNIRNR
jgi:integrase